MKTAADIDYEARHRALCFFFSNVYDADWPGDEYALDWLHEGKLHDGPYELRLEPWQPFESYGPEWLAEQVENLAWSFTVAMKWAQEAQEAA